MPTVKLSPVRHQNKTQAIRSSLCELANHLGPDARLPTMNELRDSLGVSVVTLNRALSELEAQGIISRRHGVGIFVSAHLHQKTIGLVFDRSMAGVNASPFWDMLISKARERATSHNEKFSLFLLMPSPGDATPVPDDLANAAVQGRVHGTIFIGPDRAAVEWLEQHIPVVAYANKHAPYQANSDYSTLIRLGVQQLAKRGCRRIGLWIPTGMWMGPDKPSTSYKEMEAFKDALEAAGLPFEHRLTIEDRFKVRRPQDQATELPNSLPRESRGGFQEQGYYTALQVFDKKTAKGDKPEGIVIVDDLMTRGAIAAFQKMNLRLGTDIKIATHANKDSPALLGYESDLILLEMDVAELVDGLYEMLEARIEGRPVPAAQLNVAPKVKGPS